MWDFNVGLTILTSRRQVPEQTFAGIDATAGKDASGKDVMLRTAPLAIVSQRSQHNNPDDRISLSPPSDSGASGALLLVMLEFSPADSLVGVGCIGSSINIFPAGSRCKPSKNQELTQVGAKC